MKGFLPITAIKQTEAAVLLVGVNIDGIRLILPALLLNIVYLLPKMYTFKNNVL